MLIDKRNTALHRFQQDEYELQMRRMSIVDGQHQPPTNTTTVVVDGYGQQQQPYAPGEKKSYLFFES